MPETMSSELKLMEAIRHSWGPAISAACHLSSVPEEFLAALVASETGGNPLKSRFEEKVFGEIMAVCAGKRAAYGTLGAEAFLPATTHLYEFQRTLKNIVEYSTSWGLTQIMGYQVIPFGKKLESLRDPQENLVFATVLLAQFANAHQLDMHTEHAELFACWNTGHPDPTKTYDPDYCKNGIARMDFYSQIAERETLT